MATKPNTQPVTTPALTNSLIREVLNPTPQPGSAPAEWKEHGYRAAMLDAALAEYDDNEVHSPRDFFYLTLELLCYGEIGWHCVDWDDDAEDALTEYRTY